MLGKGGPANRLAQTNEQANDGSPGEPLIRLAGVSKRFATRVGSLDAVLNVSLDIGRSEFISLIGPSGCGKTTLLKLLGDILPPSGGTILVDGKTPAQARQERSFGFVFQDPVLLPWRTVEQNVLLFHEVIGDGRRPEVREHVSDLIDLVGLDGFESHYPAELSGGMQQRVAIARALSFDPEILLMDEPFGALDLITRDKMGFELLRIWEQTRKTVVLVTHSISEAVFLSDRVVVFSARPARVLRVFDVELPRPRPPEVRDETIFHAYTRELRGLLE